MASILTLQDSVDYIKPMLGFRPLSFSTTLQPALGAGNTVIQTILGPPFRWSWNRKVLTFTTIAGIQDYSVEASDFGFIERASLTDSASPPNVFEIPNLRLEISKDSGQARPTYIAPFLDDNAGNITFRLMSVPDAVYTVTVTYQKRASLLSGLTSVWPIPDRFSNVYQWGLMSLLMVFAGDSRFAFANQKFVGGLLAISEGLDEQEKNTFLGNWMFLTEMMARSGAKTQQGTAGRGI